MVLAWSRRSLGPVGMASCVFLISSKDGGTQGQSKIFSCCVLDGRILINSDDSEPLVKTGWGGGGGGGRETEGLILFLCCLPR